MDSQKTQKSPPQTEAKRPAPRRSRHKKWPVFVVLAVIVFGGSALFLTRRGKTAAESDSRYTSVSVEPRTIVKSLSGSGTLKPADSYTLTTLVEGDILRADFEEGDTVEKDAVLYEIDSKAVSNSIAQSEHSLEQSQLSLEQSRRSLERTELSREQSEHSLEQSEMNLDESSRNLAQAWQKYNDTVEQQYVRAPESGMIVQMSVRVGDRVTAGQTVATVRDSAIMNLRVPFPADDALYFSVGQAAEVLLESTYETLPGTVMEISEGVTIAKGNMVTRDVTVAVYNPGALTSAHSASVRINGIGASASGTFSYRVERAIAAEVSGEVAQILVPEGFSVQKGQVVLTLGGEIASTIQNAENSVENASDSLRNAEISVENAAGNLRGAELSVQDAAGSLRSAELSLENAELSLQSTRDRLNDYIVTSPISGTVVVKNYKAGDKISAAGKELCTIYDLRYLEMTLNVDELDINAVSVGQRVTVTAEAAAGSVYEGVVTRVSVAGTTANGTTSYPVTIRLDETEGLLPGMNVDAEILVAESANALSIPNEAVQRGNLVLITADSPSAGKAVEGSAPEGYVYVRVETGVSDDDYVEIVSGLSPLDTVAYIPASSDFSWFPDDMGGFP